MHSARTTLFLVVVLILQGCTTLSLRLLDSPAEKVEQALAEGNYNRAWEIVTALPSGHPDYPDIVAQRDAVNDSIARFEQQRIDEAEQLAARGDWISAISLLDESRQQWSHGDALIEARNALDERQMPALMALRSELLISEANWLAARRQQRVQLSRFADPSAHQSTEHLDARQEQLADQLEVLGNWFASHGNWQRSHANLAAVRKLVPERSLPQLEQASREVAGAARRARDAESERLRGQAREYLERYRQSRDLADLLAVKDFLQQQPHSLKEERQEFELLREERYNRDLQAGDTLYARGAYQQAYDIWQTLLPLAPDSNELTGRLERTLRVMRTLEQLESGSR